MKHLPHENPDRILVTVEQLETRMYEECQGSLREYATRIGKRMTNFVSRVKQKGVRTSGPAARNPHNLLQQVQKFDPSFPEV
jgi:hypothetical protein